MSRQMGIYRAAVNRLLGYTSKTVRGYAVDLDISSLFCSRELTPEILPGILDTLCIYTWLWPVLQYFFIRLYC